MNDEKYINNITLQYLLNPILYEKIHSTEKISNEVILDDISFYRQRICKYTKDMCKGNYVDNNLKNIFINYANNIIYYLKQLDEKDIIQSDYNNLNLTCGEKLNNINSIDASNIDNIIINRSKQKSMNLDNFVKNVGLKSEKILPKKRIINIKDPRLKKKGL